MPGEGVACFARGHIPQTDGIVPTPAGEGGTIRTERNTSDLTRMPDEGGECFTGSRIPQAEGLVVTPTGEGGAIRTKHNA